MDSLDGAGSTLENKNEKENKLREMVNGERYLIRLKDGKWIREFIGNVEKPKEGTDTYNRECQTCEVRINLTDWQTHIKSEYHLLSIAIRRRMLKFCFLNNRNIPVHDPNGCQECLKRKSDLDQNININELKNPLTYCEEKDVELVEMKGVLNKIREMEEKEKNKYYCQVCDVRCFSDDFFKTHINGMKHKRNKLEQQRKESKGKKRCW